MERDEARRKRDHEFVNRVRALYPADRGRLATLRRAAGRPLREVADAHWFYGLTTELGYPEREDELVFLVATLIASHRPSLRTEPRRAEPSSQQEQRNFGWTVRRLREEGAMSDASAAVRMRQLLDAQLDFEGANELGQRLRRLVALADSRGVPVDWVTLLDDLRRWNDGTRRVQKEWARACFANAPKGGADASTDHGENDLEEGSASDAA
jgi:CRISPR type I-E-associated protein CasB/Cse2